MTTSMSRSERQRRLDEAWKTVGEDPKLKSRELAGLLAKSDTATIADLVKKTVEEREKQALWMARFWPDILLVVFGVAVVCLAAWNICWMADHSASNKVVVTKTGLSAFHILQETDVQAADMPAEPDSLSSSEQAVGLYLMESVRQGGVLHKQQLSASRMVDGEFLKSWQVITIPLKSPPAFAVLSDLPVKVGLVLTLRSEKPGSLVLDAILLKYGLKEDGRLAVVAIRNDDLQRFSAIAGQSDFFISGGLR
jgi:hypothetical protein